MLADNGQFPVWFIFGSSGWGILFCSSIRLKLRFNKRNCRRLKCIERPTLCMIQMTHQGHFPFLLSLFFLKNCIKVVFAPPNSINNLHSYLHHSAVFSFGYVFCPLIFLVPLLPLMWECSNIPLLFCTNYAVSCYSVSRIANHISGMIHTKRCAMCSAR